MTSPCCCGGREKTPCDEQEPCYTFPPEQRCTAYWPAEELYNAIAALFINNNPRLALGTVNFRLAIPWTEFGFGCFIAIDYPVADTCCDGDCEHGNCGPPPGDPSGCTGQCFSAYALGGFEDVNWRAQVYFPNQFLSACTGCYPGGPGTLTWGLPAKIGYPRCCSALECGCLNVSGNGCRFTAQAMNDWFIVVPNTPLTFITLTNPSSFGPIEEPAEGSSSCCSVVGWTGQCTLGQENPPYRRGLLFMDPPTGGAGLHHASGSPVGECEHPEAFDVYMTRRLWVLPNFKNKANCIRIVAAVNFEKIFYNRIPDIHTHQPGGQYPPPRNCCSDVGLAYVDPCSFSGEHPVLSTGWYYMDIYHDDTVAVFNKRPLRLFRVEHSQYCFGGCGYEEQAVHAESGSCRGCTCTDDICEPFPDPPCAVNAQGGIVIPAEDCPTWPSGISEVPCVVPPQQYQYPEPPRNSHFDFPENLWIVTT